MGWVETWQCQHSLGGLAKSSGRDLGIFVESFMGNRRYRSLVNAAEKALDSVPGAIASKLQSLALTS
jgi:hypothetical protein